MGAESVFLGKPFANIYDVALADLEHIPRERIIAEGDTPHTDVLGVHAARIKSLLVKTGFTRGHDAVALMEQAGGRGELRRCNDLKALLPPYAMGLTPACFPKSLEGIDPFGNLPCAPH
jgi:ribonucleotide monophosphatase NagD (HAD superfamily)